MSETIKVIDSATMQDQRMAYFPGQFLEDEDFKVEQKFHLARRRKFNKQLFSRGVRKGFAVSIHDGEKNKICIQPGVAIDASGRELWLEEEKFLSFSEEDNGAYFLYMRVQDRFIENKEFFIPSAKSKSNVAISTQSTWIGDTRCIEIIEFCIADSKDLSAKGYIKIASLRLSKGAVHDLIGGDRDLSKTDVGNGLDISIQPGEHYIDMFYEGKLNAFIGANFQPPVGQKKEAVTFSSTSKRMHLYGDQELYVLNKGGMVISNAWQGSGSLTVDGTLLVSDVITSKANDFRLGVDKEKQARPGRALTAEAVTDTLKLNYDNDWDKTEIGGNLVKINNAAHICRSLTVDGLTKVGNDLIVNGQITNIGNDFKLGSHNARNKDTKSNDPGRALVADMYTLKLNYANDWDLTAIGGNKVEFSGEITSRANDFRLGGGKQRKKSDAETKNPGAAFAADHLALRVNCYSDWDTTIIGGQVIHATEKVFGNSEEEKNKICEKIGNGHYTFVVEKDGEGTSNLAVYWKVDNTIKKGIITG